MRIYKYPLKVVSEQELSLPAGAKILSCKSQNDAPTIWALVDGNATSNEKYKVQVIGTGHDAKRIIGSEFLDTFFVEQDTESPLVFHVFISKESL